MFYLSLNGVKTSMSVEMPEKHLGLHLSEILVC